jgi:hypothetical protein
MLTKRNVYDKILTKDVDEDADVRILFADGTYLSSGWFNWILAAF